MRSYLLSTRREIVETFRLMGIKGEWLDKPSFERFLEVYHDPEVNLVFLGDSLIGKNQDELLELKAKGKKLLLVIPESGGDFLTSVRSGISQSLGMKV